MSPARTRGPEIDVPKLVRRILIDIALLKWFGTTGGRGLAVISAIALARREAPTQDVPVLDFLERHIGDGS
jgi:hypothetical protein